MSIRIDGTTGISGVDGTATAPAVQGNDTNTGIFFPANDTIAFAEGGTEVMRIDANGNVGIGNTAPISRLHVEGEVFTGRVNSSLEGGQIGFGRSSDNARLYAIDTYGSGSSPEMRMFNDLGAIVFFSASPNGVNYIKFNPTQAAQGDANCLDDYEEGTWTGTLNMHSNPADTSGTNTTLNSTGRYTKIGDMVYITIYFDVQGYSNYVAKFISGLPFTSANIPEQAISLGHTRGIRFVYSTSITNDMTLSASVATNSTSISLAASSASSAFSGWWYISNEPAQGKYIPVSGCYKAT